jgi:hypothetical protein
MGRVCYFKLLGLPHKLFSTIFNPTCQVPGTMAYFDLTGFPKTFSLLFRETLIIESSDELHPFYRWPLLTTTLSDFCQALCNSNQ